MPEADPQISKCHDKENRKFSDVQPACEKSKNQSNEIDSKMNIVADASIDDTTVNDKNKNYKADAKVSIVEVMEISDHDDALIEDLFNDPPLRNDEKSPQNLATLNKGTSENLTIEPKLDASCDEKKISQILNGSLQLDRPLSAEVTAAIKPLIIEKEQLEKSELNSAAEQNVEQIEALNGENTSNKVEIKDEDGDKVVVELTKQPDTNHLQKPSEGTTPTTASTSRKRKASTSPDKEEQPAAKK